MKNNTLRKANIKKISTKLLVAFSLLLVLISGLTKEAEAVGASLYISPSSGSFFAGSNFSLSVILDTKGSEINAIEMDLKFPPDILQVTAPTTGESFIAEWLAPPSYSNIGGTISFKGGIPGGIVTSAGLVSTITFRARSPGKAKIEFLDSSKVLLHDGKGTPIFTQNFGGVYEILVAPPEGPKIFSPSHPDPDIWYSDSSPQFFWEKEKGMTDFSYSFSQNPLENPDTISEGEDTFKFYENVSDGVWYFHLRAKKDGVWGRTSRLAVKIDTTPPQKFEPRIEVNPGFVYFKTEDFHSGIDYYEISLVYLEENPIPAPFFIESTSPFKIPSKYSGKYSVIIRAYDRAGNYQETEKKFQVIFPNIFLIADKGIQIKTIFFSWQIIYLILFVLLAIAGCLIFYLSTRKSGYKKGIKEIEEALKEIKKLEEKEIETRKLKERFEKEKAKLEEKIK